MKDKKPPKNKKTGGDGHPVHAIQGRVQQQEQPAESRHHQVLQPLHRDHRVHGSRRGVFLHSVAVVILPAVCTVQYSTVHLGVTWWVLCCVVLCLCECACMYARVFFCHFTYWWRRWLWTFYNSLIRSSSELFLFFSAVVRGGLPRLGAWFVDLWLLELTTWYKVCGFAWYCLASLLRELVWSYMRVWYKRIAMVLCWVGVSIFFFFCLCNTLV